MLTFYSLFGGEMIKKEKDSQMRSTGNKFCQRIILKNAHFHLARHHDKNICSNRIILLLTFCIYLIDLRAGSKLYQKFQEAAN